MESQHERDNALSFHSETKEYYHLIILESFQLDSIKNPSVIRKSNECDYAPC